MKLKEYLENLKEFIEENPEALEYDVISAKDDEGNGYNQVYYTPSLGFYDGEDFQGFDENDELLEEFNAVCIN